VIKMGVNRRQFLKILALAPFFPEEFIQIILSETKISFAKKRSKYLLNKFQTDPNSLWLTYDASAVKGWIKGKVEFYLSISGNVYQGAIATHVNNLFLPPINYVRMHIEKGHFNQNGNPSPEYIDRIVSEPSKITQMRINYDLANGKAFYSEKKSTMGASTFTGDQFNHSTIIENEPVDLEEAISQGKQIHGVISGWLKLPSLYNIFKKNVVYTGYTISTEEKGGHIKPKLFPVEVMLKYQSNKGFFMWSDASPFFGKEKKESNIIEGWCDKKLVPLEGKITDIYLGVDLFVNNREIIDQKLYDRITSR